LSPDPRNPLNDLSTMNKVVEYMAMGRPIVSFDLTEAQVSAGEAAVYAADDDVRTFAKLLSGLLDDPVRRAEMGEIGRTRVAEQLSWATSKRNLLGFYERLVGPATPALRPITVRR
jgi:glycosyltransferase involved in cell wall biosynthesis